MPKSRLPALYSTRRRWTADDAKIVVAALNASGLSVGAFAAREGFDAQRLYYWRQRLENARDEATPSPTFIEVRTHAAARERVEIVLRSGRAIRVDELIDAAVLRRLVELLEQEPAC